MYFSMRTLPEFIEAALGEKTVTLSKLELVDSFAVNIMAHEILSRSVFIEVQAADIMLQQRLYGVA